MYKESVQSRALMIFNKERYALEKEVDGKSALKKFAKQSGKILRTKGLAFYLKYTGSKMFEKQNATLKEAYRTYTIDELAPVVYEEKLPSKIAVYTCLIGNYDRLLEPLFYSKACDYFIITDQSVPDTSIWKKIDLNELAYERNLSPRLINRYFKIHPHLLFSEYAYSIYMDSNIQIVADMVPLIYRMENKTIGMFLHGNRTSVADEAKAVRMYHHENGEMVSQQLKLYHEEGFPDSFGLFEHSIIIRKHHDPACITIMERWWNEVSQRSGRDQLSFLYALWKEGYDRNIICVLGIDWKQNLRFRYFGHIHQQQRDASIG